MKKPSVRSLKRKGDVAGLVAVARRPLPDESSDRVVGALDALVKLGTPEAQAALLDLLDNAPPWNTGMTAWALRNARHPVTLEALVRMARGTGPETGARGQAIAALAFRGGPEADATLIHLLEDPDPHVRMNVGSILAFREPPTPEAVVTLMDLLEDSDPEVRRVAAALLSDLPHPRAAEAVRAARAGSHPPVREASQSGFEVPAKTDRPGIEIEDMPIQALGNLIHQRDVDGLARVFSLAADWDTRETVMVAFKELYRAAGSDPTVRDRLRSVLPDLLALCKAETSGGSYRMNCISAAEVLLAQLDAAS